MRRSSSWVVILEQAPRIIDLVQQATKISDMWSGGTSAAKDSGDVRAQLTGVLEAQKTHAASLTAIASQLDAMAKASSAAAEKAHLALLVGSAGMAVGLAALLVSLLR